MVSPELFRRFYPDPSKSGTLQFYGWLRSALRPEFVVLNVGAGVATDNKIRSLKGEARKVVGADIDRAVLENKDLDEAFVIRDERLPFAGEEFDLVWADFVLEHVERPRAFLKEIYRVMKPGASFFFRTPNKYHYAALFSLITPHWFHKLIANRIRGLPAGAHEPYPTYHRLNSRTDIIRNAREAGFGKVELRFIEAEPSYMMFHAVPFMAGVLYERTVNRFSRLSGLRVNILGRLEK